jgi:hypothetical protein
MELFITQLYYAALYYAALYCAALYYGTLYYAAHYFVALYCGVSSSFLFLFAHILSSALFSETAKLQSRTANLKLASYLQHAARVA